MGKKGAGKKAKRTEEPQEGAVAAATKKAKKVKAKPKGMRWLAPYLTVRDVSASIEWYESAFGFKRRFVMTGADGKPIHAEMQHKKAVIMLGPWDGKSPAPGKEGVPVTLYCYCEDVDALAASARAAGARVVEEPADQFWGDRIAFIVDPDGHQWTFATHKFEMKEPGELEEQCCGKGEGEGACCCSCSGEDGEEEEAVEPEAASASAPGEPAPAPARDPKSPPA